MLKFSFIKFLLLTALILNVGARRNFISEKQIKNAQRDYQEYAEIAIEGVEKSKEILTSITEFLGDGAPLLLRDLGAFLGPIGPACAVLKLFLGDPMDRKLDEINNKIDQVLSTIDNKFDEMTKLVSQQICFNEFSRDLRTVKTYTEKMRLVMRNSVNQRSLGGNKQSIKKFFLDKMRQEDNIIGMNNAMNNIIDKISSGGKTTDPCDFLNLISRGTVESGNMVGSSVAILKILLPIYSELDEGISYLLAMDEARAIPGEDVETTQNETRALWRNKLQKATERISNFTVKLDTPEVFSQNMKENLKTIWGEIKNQGYESNKSGDWKGDEISTAVLARLKAAFPHKSLAVFTYRDSKENEWYKSIARHEATFKTRELTSSYSRNYVIQVAFTNTLPKLVDPSEYASDSDCLFNLFSVIEPFRKSTHHASRIINSIQISFGSKFPLCLNRVGGITLVWEPPNRSSVLATDYYETVGSGYKQCRWSERKFCAMNGRMFQFISMPRTEGWRWLIYVWMSPIA